MNEDLKPCPFCGGEAKYDSYAMSPYEKANINYIDGKWHYVYCNDCLAQGPEVLSKEDAIAAWNLRYHEKSEPLAKDELMKMIGQPIWVMPVENVSFHSDWAPKWVIFNGEYVFINDPSSEGGVYIRNVKYYGISWLAYRAPSPTLREEI